MAARRRVPSAGGARPQESDQPLTRAIGQITALAALLLGAFAVVKSYAVANFSLTTGSALLAAAPVSVLLGSLMSYAYWAFPLAAVGFGHLSTRSWRRSGSSWESLVLTGVTLVAVALSPPRYLALIVVAYLAFQGIAAASTWAFAKWRAPRQVGKPQIDVLPTRAFFVLAVVFIVISTATRLWVPVEVVVVDTSKGQEVLVGTVLGLESGDWMSIMRAEDRGLMRVRSDDVLSRELCHLSDQQSPGQAPVVWWLVGRDYDSPNTGCGVLARAHTGLPVVPGSLP